MLKLALPDHLRSLFGADPFSEMMQLQGPIYRDVVGRRTMKVALGGQSYFVKQHFGIGWGEIFKNVFIFKAPILGALTEVKAIEKLVEIGIATTPLVAYGVKGINPATQQSFILTQDLGDITSLEDVCADWVSTPPDADFKRRVIVAMASLAARMHAAGLCHRDFYLCHLVLKKDAFAQGKVDLILIDLHRMRMHQAGDGKAAMKDIAGLIFSAMDCGFSEEDWALFKQHYLPQSAQFWLQAEKRAKQLYAKFHTDKFQKRLAQEKAAID
jgi:tRNA A-37 threonylcarbamoyl transferase component Bud32